jgi:hypothetical protein
MLVSDEINKRLTGIKLPEKFRGLFGLGILLYLRNMIPIAVVSIVIFLPVELLASYFIFQSGKQSDMLFIIRTGNFVFLLAGSLAAPAICHLTVHSLAGAAVSARASISFAFRRYFLVLSTTFISNLLIGLACILLVVPGIIVYSWYALVTPVASLDNTRLGGVLDRSKELTGNNRWRFVVTGFFILLAVFAVGMTLMFPPIIGLGVVFGERWWIDSIGSVFIDMGMMLFPVVLTLLYLKMSDVKDERGGKTSRIGPN